MKSQKVITQRLAAISTAEQQAQHHGKGVLQNSDGWSSRNSGALRDSIYNWYCAGTPESMLPEAQKYTLKCPFKLQLLYPDHSPFKDPKLGNQLMLFIFQISFPIPKLSQIYILTLTLKHGFNYSWERRIDWLTSWGPLQSYNFMIQCLKCRKHLVFYKS